MQSYEYMMNVCEQVELEERNEDILSLRLSRGSSVFVKENQI